MNTCSLPFRLTVLFRRKDFVFPCGGGGPLVSACNDAKGAQSWTWNGMVSQIANICAAGTKSCSE